MAAGKVPPLEDEERRTILRWIPLGCPIELDFDPEHPDARGYGWSLDDTRPVIALARPKAGHHDAIDRIVFGLHDYGTGIDLATLEVDADFPIDERAAGENWVPCLEGPKNHVWTLRLPDPIRSLERGTLILSVKDRQGNVRRVARTFRVGATVVQRED